MRRLYGVSQGTPFDPVYILTHGGKAMRFVINFEFERATKRTYRFKELAPEGREKVGVIYIQKRAFGSEQPSRITVTVEVAG